MAHLTELAGELSKLKNVKLGRIAFKSSGIIAEAEYRKENYVIEVYPAKPNPRKSEA